MLKFSQTQIQNFEEARLQDSHRVIADEIARHADGSEIGDADRIARFCSENTILQADNMRKITRAHLKFGARAMGARMEVPLRREGFSEDERVKAYLHALEEKKERLVLYQPV